MSSKKHFTLRGEVLFFLASSPCRQLDASFDRVVRITTHFRINPAFVRS